MLGYRAGTYGHMAELGLEDWFRGDFSTDYLTKNLPRRPFPDGQPGRRPPIPSHRRQGSAPRHAALPRGHKSTPPFVFIIPVRNPKDSKVRDYATVEALLDKTVRSLLQQSYPNV